MDEQLDIEFTGKKNKKGEYDPDSVSLKFNNPTINDRLAKWVRTRELVQKTVDARDEFATEEEYQNEVADMRDKAAEVKQHLMDSNVVVRKGTEGIVVKLKD